MTATQRRLQPASRITTSETKVCSKCGEEKSLEAYGRNSSKPDGLQDWCRNCRRLHQKERPEVGSLAQRRWRERHPGEDARRQAVVRVEDHGRCVWKSVCNGRRLKNHEVSIDLTWCRDRIAGVSRCELTGWRLDKGPRKLGGLGSNPYAPSFDRIDNSRGYHPDNIRVVCAFVNHMMNAYSDEDMAPVIEALRKDAHEPLDTD